MEFDKLFEKRIINSDKFRQQALKYIATKTYCDIPKEDRIRYREFWEIEMDRCINGYTAYDGDWIPGYYYFYLNYCPIQQTVTSVAKDRSGVEYTVDKRVSSFPLFFDYDYYFFMAVEEAERQNKHLCVLKSRRKGYSYKCASMMVRNMLLIRESKSYAYASGTGFLIGDGIMTKATDYLGHCDEYTAFGKRRSVKDTAMHKRCSFIKTNLMGNKIESGYMSEIIAESIAGDPDKVRGKAGKLILFEEAGKMPELEAAWNIARPSVETDGKAWGLMIAFGTGGSDNKDFDSLKKMFYNPEAYNMIGMKNIWDKGNPDKESGFFCPQYANMIEKDIDGNYIYMDKDGNTDREKSLEKIAELREPIVKNALSAHYIDSYVAENCITPQEACLEVSSNIFPKNALSDHLANIRLHESLQAHKQVGELYKSGNIIKWRHTPGMDIQTFELSKEASREGAIVIWEHPPESPRYGVYIAGIDPYDHNSSSTDSLGSCIIYKRMQGFEGYYELPVAEYTGRPYLGADAFYENIRLLLEYYNARALYENEKTGLYAYFKNNYCDYLLADQPDIIKDITPSSTVKRGKGIHMSEKIKDYGETRIRDWLVEEYAPGRQNLEKILSEPLLEELIAFNRKRGNYDRVMAFMVLMIYREELHNAHIKVGEDTERERKAHIFDEPIFTGY